MYPSPILSPSGPFFSDIHHCQVQHFQEAVIRGEYRLAFGHFAELAIESFDSIGGVDQCFLQVKIPHFCINISPGTGGEFLCKPHS